MRRAHFTSLVSLHQVLADRSCLHLGKPEKFVLSCLPFRFCSSCADGRHPPILPLRTLPRDIVIAGIIRMEVTDVPSRTSLLGIPIELREKILENVFTASSVEIGGSSPPEIATNLCSGIITACTQLHAEGQHLLTAATTLTIYDDPDHNWIDKVPVRVAKLYLPVMQYVIQPKTFEFWRDYCFSFDAHLLPSLKVFRLRGCGDKLSPTPPSICFGTILDKSKWLQMLNGNVEVWFLVDLWYWTLPGNAIGEDDGIPGKTWLCQKLEVVADFPFQVIIEHKRRLAYEKSDELESGKKYRGALVVSNLMSMTYGIQIPNADTLNRKCTSI